MIQKRGTTLHKVNIIKKIATQVLKTVNKQRPRDQLAKCSRDLVDSFPHPDSLLCQVWLS